jgi:hypothetical protein
MKMNLRKLRILRRKLKLLKIQNIKRFACHLIKSKYSRFHQNKPDLVAPPTCNNLACGVGWKSEIWKGESNINF